MDPSILKTISKIGFFKGLDFSQLKTIFVHIRPTLIQPGEIILDEGELNDKIYILLSGTITIEKSGHHIKTYKKVSSYGEISVLLNIPCISTVKTITKGQFLVIRKNQIAAALDNDCKLKRKIYYNSNEILNLKITENNNFFLKSKENLERANSYYNLISSLLEKRSFPDENKIEKELVSVEKIELMLFGKEGRFNVTELSNKKVILNSKSDRINKVNLIDTDVQGFIFVYGYKPFKFNGFLTEKEIKKEGEDESFSIEFKEINPLYYSFYGILRTEYSMKKSKELLN